MSNIELARVLKRFDQVFEDLIDCTDIIVDETKNFTSDDYKSLADTLNKRGQIIVHSNTSLYSRNLQDMDSVLGKLSDYLDD